jgi:hypothetical protein
MQDKIAIVLPVRNFGTERYERLPRCLDSYLEMTEGLSDVYVLHDNNECEIYDPILKKYPSINNLCIPSGITLMEKINVYAIDIANKYKYVGFIGDDIVFRTKWESEFVNFLSKEKFGLAHANDLIHVGGGLATHPFITSNLIKAVGFFGCPAVDHHYFDNYWMRMVGETGTVKYFPEIIMEHVHPIVNKAEKDALYHKIENEFLNNNIKYKEYIRKNFYNDANKIKNYIDKEDSSAS